MLEVRELKQASSQPGALLLGDIVISVPTARRQAAERGHRLNVELEILLVHGLLHLLGYDHEHSSREAARMRRLEMKLLGRTMIGKA
jgi:rRNA maturation RNase YbeY